jgi:hypothetical protein
MSAFDNSNETDNNWIPEGFVLVIGPDNNKYIMQEHVVPALEQDFLAYGRKMVLETFNASGTVSISINHLEGQARLGYRLIGYRLIDSGSLIPAH